MTANKPIDAALLRRWPLPVLDAEQGKEGRGQVLVVGGSAKGPGAVMLAAMAALRAGAGKLQIATAKSAAVPLAIALPEAWVIGLRETAKGELARGSARVLHEELASCDALLIGPGMTDEGAAHELVDRAIENECRSIVIDAAAIETLRKKRGSRKSRTSKRASSLVLTPHAGEMASFCDIERDEVLADAAGIAREIAAKLDAVVVLKGSKTFIASPDGTTYCNTAGGVGLGTSGSGDALSGVIAGLSARGADVLQAAVWGVFVHARAGDILAKRIAPLGFLARELLAEVPGLVASFEHRGRARPPTKSQRLTESSLDGELSGAGSPR